MGTVQLESLSVDELDAITITLRAEKEAIRDRMREVKQIRDQKVVLASLAAHLGIDVNGITREQAEGLLGLLRQTPREGDAIVTPGPGRLEGVLGGPGVQP